MNRTVLSSALLLALVGCGGSTATLGGNSDGTTYGRVWVTNAVASHAADAVAQFGGPAPVNASQNPQFGACFGTTTGSGGSYQSAGSILLSGAGGPWPLAPDANGVYRATATATWAPGTVLTLQASGGEVPAFTGSFVIPPALVLDNAPANLMTAIEGTADVVLTWSPIEAEQVWVGVQSGTAEVELFVRGPDRIGDDPGRRARDVARVGADHQLGGQQQHPGPDRHLVGQPHRAEPRSALRRDRALTEAPAAPPSRDRALNPGCEGAWPRPSAGARGTRAPRRRRRRPRKP